MIQCWKCQTPMTKSLEKDDIWDCGVCGAKRLHTENPKRYSHRAEQVRANTSPHTKVLKGGD